MKKMKIVKKNDLEINRLSKVYINKKIKTIALKEVSFNVKRGAMLALLGPNGAGKSTLINILAGIANKSSGSAHINGYNIDNDIRNAKASIGVVPQELVIDPYFTPKETLNFQAGYYGIGKEKAIPRVEKIMKKLGLYEKRSKKIRSLSGGMKRRFMIAKSLVNNPDILILDEPTAGINPTLINGIIDRLIKVNKDFGITLFVIEHNMRVIMALAQKIFCVAHGKLLAEGTPEQIKNDKRVVDAYLGAQ